jgi:DNA-binding response OmpR family regulator/DNA-binding CsgD family transcriptional regulator
MIKVLIIEDTIKLRECISEALELEGFEVIHAEDGISGIRLAKECWPDLILCDIVMPGMNGYDVLRMLRSEPRLPPFPFVFITAMADRKNIRDGMDLGADDYLVKPFTMTELLNAINARLTKQNSAENRIRLQIEKIEIELTNRIIELKRQNETQRLQIENIHAANVKVNTIPGDRQAQLMHEALRSIEINSTLQHFASQLNAEIQKKDIPEQQRTLLINLNNRIRNRSVLLNNLTVFQLNFDQTYPKFTPNLVKLFPSLSQNEIIIISAIYLFMNTQQLSVILGISTESVRKCKYRLKRKLGLEREANLARFIHELNLND